VEVCSNYLRTAFDLAANFLVVPAAIPEEYFYSIGIGKGIEHWVLFVYDVRLSCWFIADPDGRHKLYDTLVKDFVQKFCTLFTCKAIYKKTHALLRNLPKQNRYGDCGYTTILYMKALVLSNGKRMFNLATTNCSIFSIRSLKSEREELGKALRPIVGDELYKVFIQIKSK
jgi:hypothetical protein